MAEPTYDLLIDAWLDGTISPADAITLEDWIGADAAHARAFSEIALLDRHLVERNHHRDRSTSEFRGARQRPERAGVHWAWIALPAAAMLLMAGAIVVMYLLVAGQGVSPDPIDRTGEPIATLVDSTGTVIVGESLANNGGEYAAGSVVIDDGSAEFLLLNGASIHVSNSTQLSLNSGEEASIHRGHASFVCPPGAVGYTVLLPGGARVVDLGTRFDVEVDDGGRSVVRVTEGRVQVFHRVSGEDRILAAGQQVHVGLGALGQVVAYDTDARIRIDASSDEKALVLRSRSDDPDAANRPVTRMIDGVGVQLTDAVPGQWGTAWSPRKVHAIDGFDTEFEFSFDKAADPGAGGDGMCFVLQNHPAIHGLVVGERGNVAPDGTAVQGALAIAFESWPDEANGQSSAALVVEAGERRILAIDLARTPLRIENLTNSGRHKVRIRYRKDEAVTIHVDGTKVAEFHVDLNAFGVVDAEGRAWVGFGARTGQASERHLLHRWSYSAVRPSKPDSPDVGPVKEKVTE